MTYLCTVGSRLLAQHVDVSDTLSAAALTASEGKQSCSSSSTDNALELFPAGAPSVIHINKPLTRNDVTGRSGVRCRTLGGLKADVAAGRNADIQLTVNQPHFTGDVQFGTNATSEAGSCRRAVKCHTAAVYLHQITCEHHPGSPSAGCSAHFYQGSQRLISPLHHCRADRRLVVLPVSGAGPMFVYACRPPDL